MKFLHHMIGSIFFELVHIIDKPTIEETAEVEDFCISQVEET